MNSQHLEIEVYGKAGKGESKLVLDRPEVVIDDFSNKMWDAVFPILPTLPRPKGWPPLALLLAATAAASSCVHGSPVEPAAAEAQAEFDRCGGTVYVSYDPSKDARVVKPGAIADSARFVCLPRGVR